MRPIRGSGWVLIGTCAVVSLAGLKLLLHSSRKHYIESLTSDKVQSKLSLYNILFEVYANLKKR